MAYYAGVDLGATNTRAAIADATASVVGSTKQPTPTGPNGIAVTDTVLDVIRGACDDAGIDPAEITVAGIGSIGPLDLAAGRIENPANLPDCIDIIPLEGPVKSLIGGETVVLSNDADAGVLGERFYGEHSPDDMIYVTISSGIGAGVAVDGNVLSGWDGNAGEIGHILVDPAQTMECGCGRGGHWEAYCSGNNIPHYAQRLFESNPMDTRLPVHEHAPGDDVAFDAADLFGLAGDDEFVDHVIDRIADWNAIGMANLVHTYAPLVINVGGAVALNNPELILDPINERLPEMVLTNVPDVQLTTLSGEVVVHGALASALLADGHTRPENPSRVRK